MIYTLGDLLMKMGAPEVREKGRIRWHYFDKKNEEIGGFAEIRLIDGGGALVAELRRLRGEGEDDAGKIRPAYIESFYLYARKTGAHYKVTKIAFDGEEYPQPPKSVIELGLSIFHARALDISILMVEQEFNKQDILHPVIDEKPQFRGVPAHVKSILEKEAWGIVVPFRRRAPAHAAGC